ncbi:hypothetical protein [Streptomyces sp. NPDC007063]|uniref:hypothetical protein n=1 Tax=Streptomyces sp. NPDC007063 TaxID=3364772 RepID=UPI00368F0853
MTLAELAAEYETESQRAIRTDTRATAHNTAELFRRMLSNRDAANPNRITIRYRTHLDVVLRWCRQHGYRATAAVGGFTLQRGHEPALVAQPDQTLVWDGQRITIEEQP